MSLNSLPPELRRPILQIFAANNSSIACYATINKEWQSAIEAETFRSLTITLDSIFEFTEHFSGQVHRQCSLKHIRLSIGIPRFEPRDYDWIVTTQPVGTEGEFSKAVSLLFAFLEEWDAPALLEKPDGGVRLEICLPFGPCDMLDVHEIQLLSGFTYFSGTKDAGRMSRGGLPVVKVITEFIFFDSNRCTISPNTMFDIIVSLPNLARVYFERPYRTSATDDMIDQHNQSGKWFLESHRKPRMGISTRLTTE
ncbi:hypothetical protein BKA56DRAFT_77566 [Ilyonectria sp. MPI-CAGE-AT-0026]|nr:hypothetical protein BKA56DRAFT_77566 [Ilyonectria sp. MPI-CAGE-AT-0026]